MSELEEENAALRSRLVTQGNEIDHLRKRLAEQEDAIYSAYLGICVLERMCRKEKLTQAAERSKELLVELSVAFPEVYKRVLTGTLR